METIHIIGFDVSPLQTFENNGKYSEHFNKKMGYLKDTFLSHLFSNENEHGLKCSVKIELIDPDI